MSIKPIILALRGTSGKNDTVTLLKKHVANATLKEFMRLSLDPRVKFNVKKIPAYSHQLPPTLTLDDAMAGLEPLCTRKLTGNAARDHLATLLGGLQPDDAEMLELIIDKRIDCGMTRKTANKVYGSSFIKDKPYMRCDVSNPATCAGIPMPAYLEMKMDGQFMDQFTFQDEDAVVFESRQMVEYSFLGELEDELLTLGALIEDNNPDVIDPVFQGEALVVDKNGKIVGRGSNNGTVGKGKIEKTTISLAEAESIIFVLWDVLPKAAYDKGVWNVKRSRRLAMLEAALTELDSPRIRLVQYVKVNTLAEAFEQNSKWQLAGEEGSVLKSPNAIWKNGTSSDQLKMKTEFAADYVVTGIVEGTGKHKGSMGAVTYESSCGMIKGQVGGGWKEKIDAKGKWGNEMIRQYIWDNFDAEFKGRILTITGNDLTLADGATTWAISHSRINLDNGGWRDAADKSVADDYAKVKKELDSAKYVKTATA